MSKIVRSYFICFLSIIGFLASGCVSYRVRAEKSMTEDEAVQRINSFLNQANIDSFRNTTLADSVGFREPPYITDINILRKYSEIKEVGVEVIPAAAIFFGLIDPSLGCKVKLTYKDTNIRTIQRCPLTIWAWPPLYLINPSWVKVHRTAKAFDYMREKENTQSR